MFYPQSHDKNWQREIIQNIPHPLNMYYACYFYYYSPIRTFLMPIKHIYQLIKRIFSLTLLKDYLKLGKRSKLTDFPLPMIFSLKSFLKTKICNYTLKTKLNEITPCHLSVCENQIYFSLIIKDQWFCKVLNLNRPNNFYLIIIWVEC